MCAHVSKGVWRCSYGWKQFYADFSMPTLSLTATSRIWIEPMMIYTLDYQFVITRPGTYTSGERH